MAVTSPTLKMAPPIQAPSMADGMANLQGQMQKAYEASYNFGRMNPSVVQEALANGGSLANPFGFTNASQVMGLSPQELMALTNGQGVNQQLQTAQNTMDAVTGGKETRAAKQNLAGQLFQGGLSSLHADVNNKLQADSSNATRQQQAYDTQYHGQITQQEGAANRANSSEIARMGRDTQMAISKAHLELEAKRMKYMNDLQLAMAKGATGPIGTTPDPAMVTQYNVQLKNYGALDKDGTGFNFGAVPDQYKPQALQAYMQREAAKGLPLYQKYNIPAGMQQHVAGYSQLILGKDGWHGVFTSKQPGQNTQTNVTDTPVVPFMMKAPTNKYQQMGQGGIVGMPVYDQGE